MATQSPYGEFLRNRIVDALASHGANESDAEIEALLDAADPADVSEADVNRIIARAFERELHGSRDPGESKSLGGQTTVTVSAVATGKTVRGVAKLSGAVVAVALASVVAVVCMFWGGGPGEVGVPDSVANAISSQSANASFWTAPGTADRSVDWQGLFARARTPAAAPRRVAVGDQIETGDRERRRVTLPDGSVLYVNVNTQVSVTAARRVRVHVGDVFVEVVPSDMIASKQPFVVAMPGRRVTALGTRFAVSTGPLKGGVLVTQGKVKVSGLEQPLVAGQELAIGEGVPGPVFDPSVGVLRPAPRASAALDWTRDLMAKAEIDLVPESDHRGGAVVVVDTQGQPSKLSLRKFHVDVHIEDGFARTTIDQTYFNHENRRLEGTFYFPLPTDASLSRLAMYVEGTLMEGGMLERDRARDVFEQIRHTRRDPALLEWVDGSTFKMRVFPLEARQEKRIVMSYTQRLPNDYGRTQYRFPAGHNLELVDDWSTRIRVAGGAKLKWDSPSHVLKANTDEQDLILEGQELKSTFDRDLVLEIQDGVGKGKTDAKTDNAKTGDGRRFSSAVHGQHRYLMLRYQPKLVGELERKPRNWVFLFEASGNRDPLLARVQIDVIKTLLENAEHSDTFSIVRAATRVNTFKPQPVRCSRKNIRQAVKYLEASHLIGAFDFGKALDACMPFHEAAEDAETLLVHVGSAVPVVGDRDEQKLVQRIPKSLRYIGVGVGKRWSRQFMKMAASRTGGHFTQVNPDEKVTWRVFELFSTLNAPRLLNVQVNDTAERFEYLAINDALTQGQELCAIARLPVDADLPETLLITGKLRGETFRQEISVANVATNANYLPRTWARLEIDRLIADGSEKNKATIVQLSKAMYVMSPYTSLLVLENEAMYAQFKVDRGRDDHWALYPAPKKIKVVHEPLKYDVKLADLREQLELELQEQRSQVDALKKQYELAVAKNGQYEVERRLKKLKAVERELERKQSRLSFVDRIEETSEEVAKSSVVFRRQLAIPTTIVPMWSDDDRRRTTWMTQNATEVDFRRQRQLLSQLNRPQFFVETVVSGQELSRRVTSYELAYRMQPTLSVAAAMPTLESMDWNVRVRSRGTSVAPIEMHLRPALSRFAGSSVSSSSAFERDGYLAEPVRSYFLEIPRIERFGLVSPRHLAHRDGGVQLFGTTPVRFATSGRRRLIRNFDEWQVTNGAVPLGWASQQMHWDVGHGSLRFDSTIDSEFITNARGGFTSIREFQPLTHQGSQRWAYVPAYGRYVAMPHDKDVIGDLVSHAPGMESSAADELAVLATQQNAPPANGSVAPAAAKLIALARQAAWESIEIPGQVGQSAFKLSVDGQGRLQFERTVSEGLVERVVCDGDSLWHIYPDLKIGARRSISRFHRASLQTLVPWLVEPVEDLRVGANVRLLDADTVSIEPLEAAEQFIVVRMKFHDGRLIQRSMVEMPTGKTLLSVSYATDGVVVIRDADNAEISRVDYRRSVATAPNLKPDTDGILVLPLPYRTLEHDKDLVDVSKNITQQVPTLTDEQFLRVVADAFAVRSPALAQLAIAPRTLELENRLGLMVLLVSSNPHIANMQAAPQQANSGLAVFLGQLRSWKLHRNVNQEFVLPQNSPKFLSRLADAQNLNNRWSTKKPLHDRTSLQIQTEVARAFDLIAECESPSLALELLETLHGQLKAAPKLSPETTALMVERCERLSTKLADVAQLTDRHAYWMFRNGQADAAMVIYETRVTSAAAEGRIISLNADLRKQFSEQQSGDARWFKLVRVVMDEYRKREARSALIALALQSHRLGDADLATSGYDLAVEGVTLDEQPGFLVECLEFHRERKQWEQANSLFERLIKLDTFSKNAQLWRAGAKLANESGNLELEVRRLERSVELEYATWPEQVDLQMVRQRYGELLDRFAAFAKSKSEQIPMDAVSRIIRIADRWRSLDPDVTSACQKAATALDAGGYREFAWDYWTTPLANNPNESVAWLSMAHSLQRNSLVELADRAFDEAFAAEPTNAQILFEHALMLRKAKLKEKSNSLLTRLVNGTWQPRFRNVQNQAQQQLRSSDY
ncbi:MAG: VIT domain-containing protein [Planctomycetota bacterium]|nr:VIT domain-containing protein [Planctomycetota bacterium]